MLVKAKVLHIACHEHTKCTWKYTKMSSVLIVIFISQFSAAKFSQMGHTGLQQALAGVSFSLFLVSFAPQGRKIVRFTSPSRHPNLSFYFRIFGTNLVCASECETENCNSFRARSSIFVLQQLQQFILKTCLPFWMITLWKTYIHFVMYCYVAIFGGGGLVVYKNWIHSLAQ